MRRDDGDDKAVSRTWIYNERKVDKAFDKEIKRIQRESWELIADECETNLFLALLINSHALFLFNFQTSFCFDWSQITLSPECHAAKIGETKTPGDWRL